MAMKLVESQEASSPLEAWERASIHIFGAGTASQKKGCPKSAFLGLCEEGFVRGIEPGSYTTSVDNKAYALQAVEWLKKNPSLSPKLTHMGMVWLLVGVLSIFVRIAPFLLLHSAHAKIVSIALGVHFAALFLTTLFGNFPVPIIGYGFSPMIGYIIALTSIIRARNDLPCS
ncbi:hypothetical protein P4V06_17235 [Brevibacillus parabrevis]|nr:hypothetical protein [Brevibacillus parabrevis]